MKRNKTCAVLGGGPAGLMAAEVLAEAGCAVTLYERMPSIGRKFLMAGIGGLNLTHSEDLTPLMARYRGAVDLRPMIEAFTPTDLRAWCEGLGEETFVGSSGRVFPTAFKASPLLRAWLARLEGLGVTIETRHDWRGWQDGALAFETPEGARLVRPDATLLALGGASWPRLGSTGGWAEILRDKGVDTAPFRPSNCGFIIGWQADVGSRHAGTPLKSIAVSFGGETVRGEAMVTQNGIEGGAIYALSPLLREAIAAEGAATLHIDFRPDSAAPDLAQKMSKRRKGDSLANTLRKAGLSPAAIAILREAAHPLPDDPETLARLAKAAPVTVTADTGLDRAISSAGGIAANAIDSRLMLRAMPGVFAAGEMLDWEAPTGGYLLQACLASGRWAAHAAREWLA